MQISTAQALAQLAADQKKFTTLFEHGSLVLEIYKPDRIDKQQPHSRDEVYVVIAGAGEFYNDGQRSRFQAGDFLFVSAGKEHRFENFSADFCTWVLFYGPEGGEAAQAG